MSQTTTIPIVLKRRPKEEIPRTIVDIWITEYDVIIDEKAKEALIIQLLLLMNFKD